MFKLMGRIQNVVLTAAGLATAGLFGISVSDIRGCAQSSKMNGQQTLSADERQQVLRKLKIGAALSDRNLPGDDIDALIENYAEALKSAQASGISVSDYELGIFINEQFGGKDKYANFRQFMQQRYELQVSELEEYFRDQLAISKNSRLPMLAMYVTNNELKAEFHRRHDKVIYDRISIDTSAMKLAKELSEDELKAYYEENSTQAEFQVPEKVSVSYLLVRTDKLTVPAPSEEDLTQNYNLNKARYSSSGNADDAKPLEEVKEEVLASVEKEAREDLAKKLLNELDNVLLEQENVDLFGTFNAEKAKHEKFSVVESGNTELFSQKDYRVEPLGYVFNLASRLFGDNPRNYGGVLEAGNGFYIYHINQRLPKSILSFEASKDTCVAGLTSRRQQEVAETLAREWKEKLAASEDWKSLTLPEGLSYESKESEGLNSTEARQLEKAELNAVSEPIKLANEVALLRLKERVIADESSLETEKDELRKGLQQQKSYMMMGSFGAR
jgi:hypothetical protein